MFRIAGLQPNLTLVLLIAWLMVRGAEEAYVLIPIGGVLLGLVDGAPMGTAMLALAPMAVLQEMRGAQLREGGFALAIVFVAVMTVVYNFTYLLRVHIDRRIRQLARRDDAMSSCPLPCSISWCSCRCTSSSPWSTRDIAGRSMHRRGHIA